jgi:hypothetical protein
MKPEGKRRNHPASHPIDPDSKNGVNQRNSQKDSLIKRFLEWLAKGAEKWEAGSSSCPS